VNFLRKFRNRILIYAAIAVVAELSVYAIYMLTGDGYGLWFFILENLNAILFPRIYTWEAWIYCGMLGMFLSVTIIGEIIYTIARTLIHST
jgi:hypothetical protein